jgi:hypothetical protein
MNPSKTQSKGVRPEFTVDRVIENPLPRHGTNIRLLQGYLPLILKAGRAFGKSLPSGFKFLLPVT